MSPLTFLVQLLDFLDRGLDARSMPRLRAVGLAPAATVFTPSRKMAVLSTVAAGGAVAGYVGVLQPLTSCAPMFSSGSCSSISFATVTPSLVMIGATGPLRSPRCGPWGRG